MYETPLAQRAAAVLLAPFADPGEMGRRSYADQLVHRLLWMLFCRFLEALDALAARWMNGTLPEPKPQAPRPPRQARRETAARERSGTTSRQPASPLCARILEASDRAPQTRPTQTHHHAAPNHPPPNPPPNPTQPQPRLTRRRTPKPRIPRSHMHAQVVLLSKG